MRTDGMDFLPSVDSSTSSPRLSESFEASLSDSGDHHEVLSTHSSSSADSDTGSPTIRTLKDPSQSSSRSSLAHKLLFTGSSCSGPPSPDEPQNPSGVDRFPEKPPLRKGQSLLRKMEKLRLRGSTTLPHNKREKSRLIIGSPVLQEDIVNRKEQFHHLNFSGFEDHMCTGSYSPSSSSSSPSGNSSNMSTPSPVTKIRSNNKRKDNNFQADLDFHVKELDLNSQQNLNAGSVFEIPQGHKPGTFPTILSHGSALALIDSTVNWRTGSFHGYHGRRCRSSGSKDQEPSSSPLAAYEHRVSIYDNVPDHLQIMDDEVFSALDSVMERISGLQELVTSWTEKLSEDGDSDFSHPSSPSPSSLNDIHLEIKEPSEAEQTCPEQIYDKRTKAPSRNLKSAEQPSR